MLNDEEIKDDESLEVELDENQEIDEQETIENESDSSEVDTDPEETEEEEEDDLVVTIGDEEPEEKEKLPDSKLVNFLRKADRKKSKEIRDLKRQLESKTEKEPVEELVLGERPKLEDFDWDEAKKDEALEKWFEQKKLVAQQKVEKEQEQENQTKAWEQKVQRYTAQQKELNTKNFSEAEDVVKGKLGKNEQGLILHACKNPAKMVLALAGNPGILDELSKLNDIALLAYRLAEIEGQIKVRGRKPTTKPEKVLKSSGGSSVTDNTLERLREEASKTGDYSKIRAYKKNKRT